MVWLKAKDYSKRKVNELIYGYVKDRLTAPDLPDEKCKIIPIKISFK